MPEKKLRTLYLSICPWIVIFLLLYSGCHIQREYASRVKPFPLKTENLTVFGVRPAMSEGDQPGVIRSPISGAVFMANPVPQGVAERITENLFTRLLECKKYELIGPNQAKGVFSSLIASNQGMSDVELFQRIGQTFSADAVIVGYVYRWREREGTQYAIKRPASVAFDLYLLRPDDGAVLWKGRFDKTQRSLSENILDIGTFLKGKGRWMTAEELAELGLADLLDRSLLCGKE